MADDAGAGARATRRRRSTTTPPPAAGGQTRQKQRTFAEKLKHLFDNVPATKRRQGDGAERGSSEDRRYSIREAADIISEEGADDGVSISAAYLAILLNGERDNPGWKHIDAIARFFGVPAGYFFDDDLAERVDAQLLELAKYRKLKEALDDPEVGLIAVRARRLSPDSLRQVRGMIDHILALQNSDQRKAKDS
jgi:transcriptional regulator with XRE-family HTH domain